MGMHKRFWVVTFAVLLFAMLRPDMGRAEWGDVIGNGGGLAEQNFNYALVSLGAAIELCLNTGGVVPDSEEDQVLRRVGRALREEQAGGLRLHFVSEKEKPGTFLLDGEVRVAKTGDRVGDGIWINLDFLYGQNSSGQWEPMMGLPTMSAILVHELGHHLGIRDHQLLDRAGARVRRSLESDTLKASLRPDQNLTLSVINGLGDQGRVLWILEDSFTVTDLSEQMARGVGCPLPSEVMENYRISNLYWERGRIDTAQGVYLQPFRTWVKVSCRRSPGDSSVIYEGLLGAELVLGASTLGQEVRFLALSANDAMISWFHLQMPGMAVLHWLQ